MTVISNSDLLLGCWSRKSFQDDRDEQIEKDKTDDQDEPNEVEVGDLCTAALDPNELLWFVSLILDAAEVYVGLPGTIVHYPNPTLASSDPEKC